MVMAGCRHTCVTTLPPYKNQGAVFFLYLTMENITIPVPPFIAQAFTKADGAVRRKAEIYINAWLNDFFSSRPANEQLFELMQKGSA